MQREGGRPVRYKARRRLGFQALALAAAGAAIGVLFQITGWDHAISALAFDANTRTFPLHNEWWLSVAGHTALKWTMGALWLACLAAGGEYRRGALYMALIAIVVNVARNASPASCPWDLPAFGGTAPDAGRCLPAAHPLTGFAWLGLYAALSDLRPRIAWLVLAGALLVGFVAGAVQVARGAHFASHVLWTAWACAIMAWLLRIALSKKGADPRAADPNHKASGAV